jgi:apolipoprotein N-acyltransferase
MAMTASSTQPEQQANELRPEVQRIIASGQTGLAVRAGSRVSVVLLATVSLTLLWLSFTPMEMAPVAWIALVPLCQLLRLRTLPPFGLTILWAVSFVWALATLQWMRLGHPAMYLALGALAAYVALYIPVFVWVARRCIAHALPLWLAVPIVWTGLEYARAYLLTGFSWYYLGHTQYRWLSLIQISDLVGAYGVTFLVAMVSGVISEHVPLEWLQRWNLDIADSPSTLPSKKPLAAAFILVVACCGYGIVRQTPADKFPGGPAFALIQGNFTPEVKHDSDMLLTRFRVHDGLMKRSVELQPDFIVWPETMFSWPEQSISEGVTDEDILSQVPVDVLRDYGNEAALLVAPFHNNEVQKRIAADAQANGAALIIGLEAMVAGKDRLKIYNAAAFARPDLGYTGRYDKIHRVIFGEYIPLKDAFPWLTNLTPFGANFGIDAGSEVRLFEYAGYHIAPLICFEDTVPQLVRRMAAQRDPEGHSCDVLVNLTNDAWFRGSSELDQHLITATFRCVETRTPLVRAVNGGISAFIDGNGQIREPETILVMAEPLQGVNPQLSEVKGLRDPQTGKWRRQFSGIIFGQVPLDPRESLYVRFGDWFAAICLLIAGAFLAKSHVVRR